MVILFFGLTEFMLLIVYNELISESFSEILVKILNDCSNIPRLGIALILRKPFIKYFIIHNGILVISFGILP